jgi:hypothetical protein
VLVVRCGVVLVFFGVPLVLRAGAVLIVLVLMVVIGVTVFVGMGDAVRMRVRMQMSFRHPLTFVTLAPGTPLVPGREREKSWGS